MIQFLRTLILVGLIALASLTSAPLAHANSVTISQGSQSGQYSTASASAPLILGQSVTPPAGAFRLERYSLVIGASSTATTMTPKVYEIDSQTGHLTLIWTGAAHNVGTSLTRQTFEVNANIDPSKKYLLGIENSTPDYKIVFQNTSDPNSYPNGSVFFITDTMLLHSMDMDAIFSATFTTSPAIPTLTEWAMILLALGLAGGASVAILRRRPAA